MIARYVNAGERAVEAATRGRTDREAVIDTLAHVMHYAHAAGYDVRTVCTVAARHFDAEVGDEEPARDPHPRETQAQWNRIAAEIKEALQGDSNDAEHDALVSVAAHLGITWQPPDD